MFIAIDSLDIRTSVLHHPSPARTDGNTGQDVLSLAELGWLPGQAQALEETQVPIPGWKSPWRVGSGWTLNLHPRPSHQPQETPVLFDILETLLGPGGNPLCLAALFRAGRQAEGKDLYPESEVVRGLGTWGLSAHSELGQPSPV